MESQRVSLRDVARAAGTSHVTVSLALRNHPKISEKTRARIQALAEQMGYRPDPMLKALAEYRKMKDTVRYQATLGWINNFPTHEYPKNNRGFKMYREGALERASQLGYAVEIFSPYADGISLKNLRRILIARGIQGLLIAPHVKSNVSWNFDVTGFSAVLFGFSLESPRLHVVTNSQARSSVLAVERLRGLGYSRIGFAILAGHNERTAHNFLGGFLGETMPGLPKGQCPFCIFPGVFDRKQWASWYNSFKPDAVITGDLSVAEDIEATGLKIPSELAVAVLANDQPSEHWAGINQNDRVIGSVAVDTLVGMLHRNETGVPALPHRILLESTWRDGASVRGR